MVVALGALVYLAGRLMFLPPEPLLVELDVFGDRFEYRYRSYPSISALSIALEVSNEPLGVIEIRECAALPQLQSVLELVRARGDSDFDVIVPEIC